MVGCVYDTWPSIRAVPAEHPLPIGRLPDLADHLDGVSHDTVSDFLRQEHVTARELWRLVQGLIDDSPEACLIVDDSVQDKRYSRFIELVKRQWSGAIGGLVRGIGVVNLVHSAGPQKKKETFSRLIIASMPPTSMARPRTSTSARCWAHAVADKRVQAVADMRVQARTVLFDAWYAAVENLKSADKRRDEHERRHYPP